MFMARTRAVSPSLGNGELTYLPRQRTDIDKAIQQHHTCEQWLAQLGVGVLPLPVDSELPDAVFVEDTAVVVDEVAVIARMGTASRQPEVQTMAAARSRYRPLAAVRPPATLEGGDVLRLGRALYIGAGKRANREGVAQLRAALEPCDY